MINSEDLYRGVGQRIRKIREERKLTQAELATIVSLTRTSITNIEQGRQKLLLHTLYDIAAALAVEPKDLLPELTKHVEGHMFEHNTSSKLSNVEQEWISSIVTASEKRD